MKVEDDEKGDTPEEGGWREKRKVGGGEEEVGWEREEGGRQQRGKERREGNGKGMEDVNQYRAI